LHKQKNKKIIFGIKECFFSDCTNKQTKKKNPKKNPKTTTKKPPHTIVGREKWLNYYNIEYIKKTTTFYDNVYLYLYTPRHGSNEIQNNTRNTHKIERTTKITVGIFGRQGPYVYDPLFIKLSKLVPI
jgi:hypothetical protein